MRKTNSTINLSLGDEVLREVSGKKSVLGIWQSQKRFTWQNLKKIDLCKEKLYTLLLEKSSSIMEHIYNFNKVIIDPEGTNAKDRGQGQGTHIVKFSTRLL